MRERRRQRRSRPSRRVRASGAIADAASLLRRGMRQRRSYSQERGRLERRGRAGDRRRTAAARVRGRGGERAVLHTCGEAVGGCGGRQGGHQAEGYEDHDRGGGGRDRRGAAQTATSRRRCAYSPDWCEGRTVRAPPLPCSVAAPCLPSGCKRMRLQHALAHMLRSRIHHALCSCLRSKPSAAHATADGNHAACS